MKFLVIAVGHKMPAWINAGFNEYVQRMPRASRIELKEIKPAIRSGNGEKSVQQWRIAEADRIRAALPARCFKVVLDECGKPCATTEFARRIERWKQQGQDVVFVIGGADGTAREYETRLLHQPFAVHLSPAGGIATQAIAALDISGSMIRDSLARGVSPRYLLPDPVLDYIRSNDLYVTQEMNEAR